MSLSFRTRLFVTAGLIVGVVLCAVLVLGWSRVLAYQVLRLDERLCMEARRLATQPFHAEDPPRLQADLMNKLRLSKTEQLIVRFEANAIDSNPRSASSQPVINFDSQKWQSAKNPEGGEAVDAPDRPGGRPQRPETLDSPRRPQGTEGPERDDRRPPRAEGDVARPPPERARPPGACALALFESPAVHWRGARFGQPGQRSIVAVDLAATESELQGALKEALKPVLPLALLLTALGAWLLSSLTMRPVTRLRNAMKDVTQKALDRRLSTQGEDKEFKVLIDAYNTMLERLETSFQQASRFSADAAHELKTPLTILQGRIEQALHKANQPAVQKELGELLDEVARLSVITRKLLLLSQADAGQLALQSATVDLSGMLGDLAADAHMLLTDQTLACDIGSNLSVQGDVVLLRQLFNNLISNAVRYCRSGGQIKLSARALPTGLEVVFSNDSDVISKLDRARFFDRFYRGDKAHSRRVDGHGLGLGLALEIARAHGGNLVLVDAETTSANQALDRVTLRLTLPA